MRIIALICVLFMSVSITGQQVKETRELSPEGSSPEASLKDVQWIQGRWMGEALGGQVEEIWSPPLGESMMGSFKLVQDDKVVFYEIMAISEVDQTLIMRLKHFDSDLKGWEEKEETVDFKLVAVEAGKVFFDGLTFEKVSDDEINVYVRFENDGSLSEGKFNYHRQLP